MPEHWRHERGLLDTSVIIDLEALAASQLPREVAVSAITMAELAARAFMQQAIPRNVVAGRTGCSAPKLLSILFPSTAMRPGPTAGSSRPS